MNALVCPHCKHPVRLKTILTTRLITKVLCLECHQFIHFEKAKSIMFNISALIIFYALSMTLAYLQVHWLLLTFSVVFLAIAWRYLGYRLIISRMIKIIDTSN